MGLWNDAVAYEIYVPSFKDANGDGKGDLSGILSQLPYLQELGVNMIWLTPFYPSPGTDNGYDISDYCDVASEFGTLHEMKQLIEEAHVRNIRVIIDVVFNHTSIEHRWFQESRQGTSKKRDYYHWVKEIPNNWSSYFGGSAWTYDEVSESYYLSRFSSGQADLDWSNPNVINEIEQVLSFWMDFGVDGFRFDVINFPVFDLNVDNPLVDGSEVRRDQNQAPLLPLLEHLTQTIRARGSYFLVAEVGSEQLEELSIYQNLFDVVFNFNLGSMKTWDPERIVSELNAMEAYGMLPTLFFGSHDMTRFPTRFQLDETGIKQVLLLLLTAKGVPFLYNGDEVGLPAYVPQTVAECYDIQAHGHYRATFEKTGDEAEAVRAALASSRDGGRNPLPWSDAPNRGFSDVSPWMPFSSDTLSIEAERMRSDSIWNFTASLIRLRKEQTVLTHGDMCRATFEDGVLRFERVFESTRLEVNINFTDERKSLRPGQKLFSTHMGSDMLEAREACLLIKT